MYRFQLALIILGGLFAGEGANADEAKASNVAAKLAELPKGITSFGSAIVGDYVYVYGGHFGRAHHYSNKSQSNELSRLKLDGSSKWEVVAKGPRLQGLAMVAHKGSLYRVGGFTAHNKEGDEHDLRSVADVTRFDIKSGKWAKMTPLPEPRSSHDAVVIGDRLYVAGGWQLGEEQQWHATAWSADLTKKTLKWEKLTAPPFKRRAISLGTLDGQLYVIGGMQQEGGPTTRVGRFDPKSGRWSEAPPLVNPGAKGGSTGGMEGFGSSAFHHGNRLFVSTYGGNLQVLDKGAKKWKIAKKLEDDRFFHRMVPFQNRLLLIGGASMTAGKRLHTEDVDVSKLD